MQRRPVLAVVVLALAVLATAPRVARAQTPSRSIMPWFCLERCGANATGIAYDLQQIAAHYPLFTKASMELFNLGPGGTLVRNNLTAVNAPLRAMGVRTYPMISSYPYPPDFLSYMRALFNDSAAGDAFIAACVDVVQRENMSGLNVDWEPQTGPTPTPQDALDYARFLDKFAHALHAVGAELTVDVARWSPVFNYPALGRTAVDRVVLMDTYAANFTVFQERLVSAIEDVGLAKLAVGLSTLNLGTGQPFAASEIGERFELVSAVGVSQIGLWLMPVPDDNGPGTSWIPFLQKYLAP